MGASTYRVQCRDCMRRRPVEETGSVSRSGGGTYRRGGRSYHSTMCVECARGYVRRYPNDFDPSVRTGRLTVNRWGPHGIARLVERVDGPGAVEKLVADGYAREAEEAAHRDAERAAGRAPWWETPDTPKKP